MSTLKRTQQITLALAGLGVLAAGIAGVRGVRPALSASPAIHRAAPSGDAALRDLPLALVWSGAEGKLYSRVANQHTVAAQAEDGGWWLGTPSGVKRVDKDGVARLFTTADGLPALAVEAVAAAPNGAAYCIVRGPLAAKITPRNREGYSSFPDYYLAPRWLCAFDPRTNRWSILQAVKPGADLPEAAVYEREYRALDNEPMGRWQIAVAGNRAVFVGGYSRSDSQTPCAWVWDSARGKLTPLALDETTRADNFFISVVYAHADDRGLTLATNRGVLRYDWSATTWQRFLPAVSVEVAAQADENFLYLVGHTSGSRVYMGGQDVDGRWSLTRLDVTSGATQNWTPPEMTPAQKRQSYNHFRGDTYLSDKPPVSLFVARDGAVWSTHIGRNDPFPPGSLRSGNGHEFYGGWLSFRPAEGVWNSYALREPLGESTKSPWLDIIGPDNDEGAITFGGSRTEGLNGTPAPPKPPQPPIPPSVIPDGAYAPFCLTTTRDGARWRFGNSPDWSGGLGASGTTRPPQIYFIQQRFANWMIDDASALPDTPAARATRLGNPFMPWTAYTPNPALLDPDSASKTWVVAPTGSALIQATPDEISKGRAEEAANRAAYTEAVERKQRPLPDYPTTQYAGHHFPLPTGITTTAPATVNNLLLSRNKDAAYLWLLPDDIGFSDNRYSVQNRQTGAWADISLTPQPTGGAGKRAQTTDHYAAPVPDGTTGNLLTVRHSWGEPGSDPASFLDEVTPPRAKSPAGSRRALPIAPPFDPPAASEPTPQTTLIPRLDATPSIWLSTQRYKQTGRGGWGLDTNRQPRIISRLPAGARRGRAVGREAWQTVPDTFPSEWRQPEFAGAEVYPPRPIAASDTIVWFQGAAAHPDAAHTTDRTDHATLPVIFGYDIVRHVWLPGQTFSHPFQSRETTSLVADPAGGDGAVLLMASGEKSEPTVFGWSPASGVWGVVADPLPAWAVPKGEHHDLPRGRIVGATAESIYLVIADQTLCRWDRKTRTWDAQAPSSSLPPAIRTTDVFYPLRTAFVASPRPVVFAGTPHGLWSLALADPKAAWTQIPQTLTLPAEGGKQTNDASLYRLIPDSPLPVGGGVVYARASAYPNGTVGVRLDAATGKWHFYDSAKGFPQKDENYSYFWDGREVWLTATSGVYRHDTPTDRWYLVYRNQRYDPLHAPPPASQPNAARGTAHWVGATPATARDENAYLLVDVPIVPTDAPATPPAGGDEPIYPTQTVVVRWNTRTGTATLMPNPSALPTAQATGAGLLRADATHLLVATHRGVWRVATDTSTSGGWKPLPLPAALAPFGLYPLGIVPATVGRTDTPPGDIWVLSGSSAFLWHLPVAR